MSESGVLSDIIAVGALIMSGYAIYVTRKFNERQSLLIDSQRKLNDHQLREAQENKLQEFKADLGANIVKFGLSNYKLKIFNKGKCAATNIRLAFPTGAEFVIDSEVAEKFPLEKLEPHQSVDLIAVVHMETKAKHTVEITWSDQDALNKTIQTIVTI